MDNISSMESPDQHISLHDLIRGDESSSDGSELSLLHASSTSRGSSSVNSNNSFNLQEEIQGDEYYQERKHAHINKIDEIMNVQMVRGSLEVSDTTVQGGVEEEERSSVHFKRLDDEAAYLLGLSVDDAYNDTQIIDDGNEDKSGNEGVEEMLDELSQGDASEEYVDFGVSSTPPHDITSDAVSLTPKNIDHKLIATKELNNSVNRSLEKCRKLTVMVRVRPNSRKIVDCIDSCSSHCLFPPSPSEAGSLDGSIVDKEIEGDIIAVNPTSFGSSQFPNSHMALNVARSVAEIVSFIFLKS